MGLVGPKWSMIQKKKKKDIAFLYNFIMRIVRRLSSLRSHIQTRGFASSPNMAALKINSKYKMLSGYEIPVLGYGVSLLECS